LSATEVVNSYFSCIFDIETMGPVRREVDMKFQLAGIAAASLFAMGSAFAGPIYTYSVSNPGQRSTGSASYLDHSAFIGSYQDVLSVDTTADGLAVSFNDLDISSIAPGTFGPDWTGATFGEMFGGWFHFAALDAFAITDGKIMTFSPSLQTWLDVADQQTEVPEPVGLGLAALAGVGALVLYRQRRRNTTA
jgi:MYXO-CTERM domain-containing protein